MLVTGKHLSLRTVREADLDRLYTLNCDVQARGEYFPVYITSETAFRNEFQQHGFWSDSSGEALICGHELELLGLLLYFKATLYFHGFEVGYRLFDTRQSNRGIMTEALSLFTYLLFTAHPINRLELKIMPANIASKRVAMKCGYQLEGIARGGMYHRGAYGDMEVYSILRHEAPSSLEDTLARIP